MRACGFKSRLPHPLKESNQVIGCSFLLYKTLKDLQPINRLLSFKCAEESLEPGVQGLLGTKCLRRSVRPREGAHILCHFVADVRRGKRKYHLAMLFSFPYSTSPRLPFRLEKLNQLVEFFSISGCKVQYASQKQFYCKWDVFFLSVSIN